MLTLIHSLKSRLYSRLDDHMAEVVSGASIAFVLKVLGAGLSFCFNILLARLFGAEGAGIYFLALTVTTVGATLGRFGLENTLLRFISAHAARGEWSEVKGVYRKGMRLGLVISLLLSILLFVAVPFLAEIVFAKPIMLTPLRWMILAITPLALLFLLAESLKGLKRIADSQILQGIALPAFTCLGLLLIGRRFGVSGASIIYLIATVSAVICGLWLWRRATPKLRELDGDFPLNVLISSSVPLLLIQLMYMVMNWTATFTLGVWGTEAEVGVFGAAFRTAMLTSFILTSVNSIVAPKFAAFYSQGDMLGLAAMAQKSTKMMIAFAAPILLIFLLAPSWVMEIFGGEFRDGGLLLMIMAVGQFVNVATGSVGYLLIMCGRERRMRTNTVVVGLLTIILNLILVPIWGALGAALATGISMALLNLGAFYFVWKDLGIWTIPFVKRSQI